MRMITIDGVDHRLLALLDEDGEEVLDHTEACGFLAQTLEDPPKYIAFRCPPGVIKPHTTQ